MTQTNTLTGDAKMGMGYLIESSHEYALFVINDDGKTITIKAGFMREDGKRFSCGHDVLTIQKARDQWTHLTKNCGFRRVETPTATA
jgi:hypothetical protein